MNDAPDVPSLEPTPLQVQRSLEKVKPPQPFPTKVRYPLSHADVITLDNKFTYHSPITDQNSRYVDLRLKAKELAHLILLLTPPSREQSLAITKIEESIFWANAAIARNEKP